MYSYIFSVICIILLPFLFYHYLASMQLNGYDLFKIIDRHNRKLVRFFVIGLYIGLLFFIANILAYFYGKIYLTVVFDSIFYLSMAVIIVSNKNNFSKTPLVWTYRMKRLFGFCWISTSVLILSIVGVFSLEYEDAILTAFPCISVAVPLFVFVFAGIIMPFEFLNNSRYIRIAKKRFEKSNAKIIAITGSYAKTSVKTILAALLSQNFKVVCSEKNYNTPMGLALSCRNLTDETDIFIAEMGARHVGDIKKLVNICKPDIAVVTGICNQHLETFKSLDNVIAAKSEIFRELKNDGVVFFNGKNLYCQDMYEKCEKNKYLSFVGKDRRVYASDVVYTENGTDFCLHINEQKAPCSTKLLGESAIENIVLCSMIADYLGISIEKIAKSIETLEYIPHRLEVIKANGITIIDDSYNGNEKGVSEAVTALTYFKGRKLVLVSGIVEMGENEENANYLLGERIASAADYVIMIDTKQSDNIYDGLINSGFDKKNIAKYAAVNDAIKDFNNVLFEGDNLLILSDLPSNYSK